MKIIRVGGVDERRYDGECFARQTNKDFLTAVLGDGRVKRIHFLSREAEVRSMKESTESGRKTPSDVLSRLDQFAFEAPTMSMFVRAAHSAFAGHLPLALSPEVLWFIVAQEVASHVKMFPDKYAHLFTTKAAEKQKIVVRDDTLSYDQPCDWLGSIPLVRQPLREKLPTGIMELCLPHFSTQTPETEAASLVAFMDAVSEYYSFEWVTLCGIPAFRLEGERHDWGKLLGSVRGLKEHISGLTAYFSGLEQVFSKILSEYDGDKSDEFFWSSFYKVNNGSGGPYVNGWINLLYAHKFSWENERKNYVYRQKPVEQAALESVMSSRSFGGTTTNQFPSNVAVVDFQWRYHEREIPMLFAAGIFNPEIVDDFITPRLGVAVIEKNQ